MNAGGDWGMKPVGAYTRELGTVILRVHAFVHRILLSSVRKSDVLARKVNYDVYYSYVQLSSVSSSFYNIAYSPRILPRRFGSQNEVQ